MKSVHRHISAFISHSAANNDEAQRYGKVLKDGGFSVFQYGDGLRPGDPIGSVLREKISKCHFFMLVISEHSLNSQWVQRELGLALSLQKERHNYRPIIIPIYAKEATWRRTGERPKQFPVLDFESGKMVGQFDLTVRGWDKYSSPSADSDKNLISFLKPNFIVSRSDFDSSAAFFDTGVFKLYKDLFPPVERDDEQDIMRWVLTGDVGQKRTFVISEGNEISYTLDSRYFILKLAGSAIGLGFFTYDYAHDLIYGNYIGVQECWRGGDIARAFFLEIMKFLEELFPQYQGMVFEVEKFDHRRVEQIIAGLEKSRPRPDHIKDPKDLNEIRRFLRVTWYHSLNCFFFFDQLAKEPLLCRSPCIDPSLSREEWSREEEDYWIMWYRPMHSRVNFSNAKELWSKAVKSIYIEILAKSLCDSSPQCAQQYWDYVNAITHKTLKDVELNDVCFSKFLDRHSSPLLARWMALEIDVPI
ncbi:toll/interleukin-1 receptor domain-containing protein [Bradyrhizobium sp. CB2312]|uniref:toll/interleukin-1 receptor domain-containing protein n=1 Tax=Bradyrhizobium sp. CB2312 TaxID=3039155 RepID=UPI0024B18CD6|nr:toll/interleukin-1 receptor domain-containing protein [Bradyrhizobium sp. CB2312]WFU70027.1 toll/interleukin-1 receptor domain-containing protein [Bradyrhizobium sp. CB2312]